MNKSRSFNNKKSKASAKGITAISIRGYKSLYGECRLEIRPLTILAGANSSGKSSAMQPLLLLKQTSEAIYKPTDLLLDGPNVRFASTERLFSKKAEKTSATSLTIKLEIEASQSLIQKYRKSRTRGIEISETAYKSELEKITLRPGMTHEEIIAAFPGIEKKNSLRWKVRRMLSRYLW